MCDNGPGFLEVGINNRCDVVINLPRDMTGHIAFSPNEARALGNLMIKKAAEAEQERLKFLLASAEDFVQSYQDYIDYDNYELPDHTDLLDEIKKTRQLIYKDDDNSE